MEEHRLICNKVKASIIEYAARMSGGCVLVDLCCGRGGDIFKWNKSNIKKVLAIDNHPESIKEAINRYKKVSKKIRTRISFMIGDISSIDLTSIIKVKVPIISCQFALHYFDLEDILRKVSENLIFHLFRNPIS